MSATSASRICRSSPPQTRPVPSQQHSYTMVPRRIEENYSGSYFRWHASGSTRSQELTYPRPPPRAFHLEPKASEPVALERSTSNTLAAAENLWTEKEDDKLSLLVAKTPSSSLTADCFTSEFKDKTMEEISKRWDMIRENFNAVNRPWTKTEDDRLYSIMSNPAKANSAYFESQFVNRSVVDISQRWRVIEAAYTAKSQFATTNPNRAWTPEEDALLLKIGAERKEKKLQWKALVHHFEYRTSASVQNRYNSIKGQKAYKGPNFDRFEKNHQLPTEYRAWTKGEDDLISTLSAGLEMTHAIWKDLLCHFRARTVESIHLRWAFLRCNGAGSDPTNVPRTWSIHPPPSKASIASLLNTPEPSNDVALMTQPASPVAPQRKRRRQSVDHSFTPPSPSSKRSRLPLVDNDTQPPNSPVTPDFVPGEQAPPAWMRRILSDSYRHFSSK